MASPKFVTALVLLLASVQAQVYDHGKSHHLVIGQRQYNDVLVYQENINEPASLIGQKVIKEQTFNAIKDHVITEVRALDQATDDTGATVTVTGGGPGQDFIKLRFKSQRFHGVYFTVQVYAKPK